MHIAVFGDQHHAAGAPVQPVHYVDGGISQVMGRRPHDGDGFLRQRRSVDGDARRLVHRQQMLILPQNGEGKVHRHDGGGGIRVGHIHRQHIAHSGHGGKENVFVVQQHAFAPHQRLAQGGGDAQPL